MKYILTDGDFLTQLRLRLSTTDWKAAVVSTELKTSPTPASQVWVTRIGGNTTSWGQQDITFSIRCIAATPRLAADLASTVRAVLDDEDAMYELLDGSPSEPIYSVVSEIGTSTPSPSTLLIEQNQSTYYFTTTVHEVGTN